MIIIGWLSYSIFPMILMACHDMSFYVWYSINRHLEVSWWLFRTEDGNRNYKQQYRMTYIMSVPSHELMSLQKPPVWRGLLKSSFFHSISSWTTTVYRGITIVYSASHSWQIPLLCQTTSHIINNDQND